MEAGAEEYFEGAARWLSAEGVHVGRGLSDSEVATIEGRYEFRFPADLRMFLQTALPLSAPESKRVWIILGDAKPSRRRPRVIPWSFPNWRAKRKRDLETLNDLVATPVAYAEFHLAQGVERGFWRPWWGERPSDLQEAKRRVVERVRAAPCTM
jgi:hypothetical protein